MESEANTPYNRGDGDIEKESTSGFNWKLENINTIENRMQ